MTSGSVNVYLVRFTFSEDWKGLTKTAVFRVGEVSASVLLDESGQCIIPWEVLSSHGRQLTAGVCGTRGEDVVMPTSWAILGPILEGAKPGQETQPPTPELWEQALAAKGGWLEYDGLNLSLMSGGKPLSTVQITGGEKGGVSDHCLLVNRDAENQHPITSISGLAKSLERIPEPAEALTNSELEAILR